MALSIHNTADVAAMEKALGKTSDVLRKLGHKGSVRARQRAIAFYLAHDGNGWVDAENLRRWCKRLDAYNRANFAQNMTKEAKRGLVIGNIRTTGGWHLTEKGAEYAAELYASVNRLAALIASTLTIKCATKAVKCALCLDDVAHDEHKVCCSSCSLTMHHECNTEMRSSYEQDRCSNKAGYTRCSGRMVEHNAPTPTPVEENAA